MKQDEQEQGDDKPELTRHERLKAKYGGTFPDLDAMKDLGPRAKGEQWVQWLQDQLEVQSGTMRDKQLHWTRHRLFRWGHQWISSRDGRTWREPEARNNRVRRVFNIIGPGLDFRLGILQEQRPGWKHEPLPGQGTGGREVAEAQQSLVEHVYKTQKIWRLSVLCYAQAQTDGVAFLQVYVDKNKGPSVQRIRRVSAEDERHDGLIAAGYDVDDDGSVVLPLGPSHEALDPGSEASSFQAGEICTRLLLASEVFSDPEAETVNGPNVPARWMLVRRPRDLQAARTETNDPELESDGDARYTDLYGNAMDTTQRWSMGLPPFPRKRLARNEENVWDWTVYLSPDPDIGKDGLCVRVLGRTQVSSKKLIKGVIPLARITDGSSDTDMFPRPDMSDWISEQATVNALGSKIMEYSRMHAGSRLLSLKDTMIEETYNNITGSIIEYRGKKPDVLEPPRVSPDLWGMFRDSVSRLENLIGHNDLNRGQVSNVDSGFQDVSGRAILGAREMSERQFGPMIRAAADGLTDWAEIVVLYAQHLYQTPRLIPMVGRPDLAKALKAEDIAGPPSVFLDPQTLVPLPRALRNQMLVDHLDRGMISQAEYAKRSPYAEIQNLNMGEVDQWNRAQWINTMLEERWEEYEAMDAIEMYAPASGIPVVWQDVPETHMSALEELVLDDRKPEGLRKLARDRWGLYAELARSKNHPIELEMGLQTGQPVPRPPAPLEVLGVPNMVPQAGSPSKQQRTGPQAGQPGGQSAPQGAAPDIQPVTPR